MRRAIYAASLDPVTRGHINVIERALNLFDEVVVGIGVNPDKKYTFTLEERESLARQALAGFGSRITVKSFPGLLSDFAYENGINTIIRGARNSADFDFERLLKDINQGFRQGVETLIYIADQNLSHISSSAAKELAKNQADNLLEYVPLIVKRALERRVAGQYLIGVTGEIGCGKSYVTKALCTWFRDFGSEDPRFLGPKKIHSIDLDEIGHEVLEKAPEHVYAQARLELATRFGKHLLKSDGMIDTPGLGKIIFSNPAAMTVFNRIMKGPMSLLLRRKLMSLKGVIFINSALIAEEELSTMVNNDVIVVTAPREIQEIRLRERGYTDEVIQQRLSAQLSVDNKIEILETSQREHRHGRTILYDNSRATSMDPLYYKIKKEILDYGVK